MMATITTATPSAPAKANRSRRRFNLPAGVGGTLWLIITLLPVYYVVITSLKSQEDVFNANPLLPSKPTFDSYKLVLESGFLRYFLNSIIVTGVTVAVAVSVSLMAAYAIVRGAVASTFLKRSFSLLLLGLAIPLQAVIIPIYYMITKLHLYDTLLALILPSVAFSIPLSVIILVNFLRDIPNELYESMRLEGATDWTVLRRLILPLGRPAITTVAIYNGLNVWNGFLFPLILTQSPSTRVLPLALWTFQGQFTVNVPAVLAAVVLTTLPILVLYILGRRQLLSGLTAGFSK